MGTPSASIDHAAAYNYAVRMTDLCSCDYMCTQLQHMVIPEEQEGRTVEPNNLMRGSSSLAEVALNTRKAGGLSAEVKTVSCKLTKSNECFLFAMLYPPLYPSLYPCVCVCACMHVDYC